jgi:hypothetical protein
VKEKATMKKDIREQCKAALEGWATRNDKVIVHDRTESSLRPGEVQLTFRGDIAVLMVCEGPNLTVTDEVHVSTMCHILRKGSVGPRSSVI